MTYLRMRIIVIGKQIEQQYKQKKISKEVQFNLVYIFPCLFSWQVLISSLDDLTISKFHAYQSDTFGEVAEIQIQGNHNSVILY